MLVGTDTEIKYVEVPQKAFHKVNKITDHRKREDGLQTEAYRLKPSEIVAFRTGVRIIQFSEVHDNQACAVTENLSGKNVGQISFLRMNITRQVGGSNFLELDELNDRFTEENNL